MKHTKAIQGKDNHAKAIQALNEEQIRMRKAVIQNQMALDMLTATQGGTCAIIKVECCIYIPDLSGKVSATLDDMKNQVKAMSNDNPPFWTSVFSWIKGDWWKNLFVIILLIIILIFGPCILQCIAQCVTCRLIALLQLYSPRVPYTPRLMPIIKDKRSIKRGECWGQCGRSKRDSIMKPVIRLKDKM